MFETTRISCDITLFSDMVCGSEIVGQFVSITIHLDNRLINYVELWVVVPVSGEILALG